MAKKKKLGRSFNEIVEADSSDSHKEILQELVSDELVVKQSEVAAENLPIDRPVEISSDLKVEKERQKKNEFIWFKDKRDSNIFGLGKTSCIWESGIIIETARKLDPGKEMYIETVKRFGTGFLEGAVLKCDKDERGLYISELEI